MKEVDFFVLFVKVDVIVEIEFVLKYDVSGYLILKIFRKGEVYVYEGFRDEEGIIVVIDSFK